MKSLILILLLSTNINLHSKGIQTDSIKKNAIKIDLQSLYYTVFDAREQIRLGIEYERVFKPKFSHYTHLDFGMYDNYQFTKVHDFFGANGGPFEDKTKVLTTGFHILEGLHYNFLKSRNNKLFLYSGLILDWNIFNKKISFKSHSSHTVNTTNIIQNRIGLGPEFSFKIKLYKNMYFDIKQALIINTYRSINKDNVKIIKPFKSYWFSQNQSTWLISMINLSYEF